MSQTARVTSTEIIREFRGSLCRFGEDVRSGLGAVDMEVRRAHQWIAQERPMYWQAEIKRRKETLSLAQAELFRRKIQGGPGKEVSDTEQKEMVRVAKRRLDEAEAKLAVVRKWIPVFEQAVFEYQSRARPTGDMLEGDLGSAIALLDRMSAALDAYLAMAPPSGPAREPSGSASGAGSSATSGASVAMPLAPETEDVPDPQPAEPAATPDGVPDSGADEAPRPPV